MSETNSPVDDLWKHSEYGLCGSEMDESTIGEDERIKDRVQQDGKGGPLQDVFFSYDSFELSKRRAKPAGECRLAAKQCRGQGGNEGHCDERGTAEYNLALAQNGPVPRRII